MVSLFWGLLLSCAQRTAIEPPVSSQSLKFIAGSCNHQLKSQSHWLTLSEEKADYYLALGDNVYADTRTVTADGAVFETSLEQLTAAYSTQANHAEFQAFLQDVNVIPTWDDHDYGLNDAGSELSFASESQGEFLTFWSIKNDPRWNREGIYHSQLLSVEEGPSKLLCLTHGIFAHRFWR